jgi:hypothetical protein
MKIADSRSSGREVDNAAISCAILISWAEFGGRASLKWMLN